MGAWKKLESLSGGQTTQHKTSKRAQLRLPVQQKDEVAVCDIAAGAGGSSMMAAIMRVIMVIYVAGSHWGSS